MDKSALVSYDIENGKEIVDVLDHAGKNPSVALWAKLPEYEDWRLVIASDRLNQASTLAGFEEIFTVLKAAGIPHHKQPTIYLQPMDKPFIHALRNVFAKTADTYGMRLGDQKFGDQYIEDAFVYRIQ